MEGSLPTILVSCSHPGNHTTASPVSTTTSWGTMSCSYGNMSVVIQKCIELTKHLILLYVYTLLVIVGVVSAPEVGVAN